MSPAPIGAGAMSAFVVFTRDEILDVADALLRACALLRGRSDGELVAWADQALGLLEDRVANPAPNHN